VTIRTERQQVKVRKIGVYTTYVNWSCA